jgi:Spy/CpxP family protein refolding chaperone
MKPASLRLALLLSVALNLGVIATITLDRVRTPAAVPNPPLHQVLGLNADQRARWEAAERPFLSQLDAATAQLEAHRAALIDALFADTIDSARIESARAAIAELQQTQQRLIIEQLIAERAILDAPQRAQLATLLRGQPGTHRTVEDLHGR